MDEDGQVSKIVVEFEFVYKIIEPDYNKNFIISIADAGLVN